MDEIRLKDISQPMFLFASTFGERVARGAIPSLDLLKSELKQLVFTMDGRARTLPALYARYEKLRYGLIALADEVVVNSEWSMKSAWVPLEMELLGTQVAGDRVYEIIDALTHADSDLAECYFYVLSLGFRGKYILDESRWAATLRRLYDLIPKTPGMGDIRLTPNAYKVIAKKATRLDPLFSLWRSVILFAICLIGIIVFYQVVWVTLVGKAEDTARSVTSQINDAGLRKKYEEAKR